MSEIQNADQAQWPEWANTPEKRERNRRYWARHNERVQAADGQRKRGWLLTVTITSH